jgi:small subunit ribosomal protein S16
MKAFGRRHRPFFRVCVTDARTPRDGRVLEEVGYYDPMVSETDARTVLKGERIDYWIGVGAQPSDKVAVLIKKYGTNGTHLEQQKAAVERLAAKRRRPSVPTDLPKMEKVVRKKKEGKKIEEEKAEEAVAPVENNVSAETAPVEEVVTSVEAVEAVQTDTAPVEVAQENAAPAETDQEAT